MDDHVRQLEETVHSILAKIDHPVYGELGLDEGSWAEFDRLGFTTLTVPERLGGSGGSLRDAATVVRSAATMAAPIMEASFLAGPVLASADLAWPGGVVTAAAGSRVTVSGPDRIPRLHGIATRVPWLRAADNLVLLVPGGPSAWVFVVSSTADGLAMRRGTNLAGEPRDDAVLDAVRPSMIALLGEPGWGDLFAAYGAVGRSAQIAGAAAQMLAATRSHVTQRVQFGRPLVKFQAVQHEIARLAGNVATLRVACDAAVLALRDHSDAAPVLSAAAKIEASCMARAVGAAAHQLHGAIGTTREHMLGTCSTRLWAWREEYGNELVWQQRLGELIISADRDIWALVTGVSTGDRTVAGA